MKHTLIRYYADNGRIFIESSDTHSIQIASYGSSASQLPDSEQKQMGALIARALNSHDRLLAALESCAIMIETKFTKAIRDAVPEWYDLLTAAQTAIHNATKE